jgi:TolB protein
MQLPVRRPSVLFLMAALAVPVRAAVTRAQVTDTTRGVRIGLTYAPGSKPGLIVLPVAGDHGDSVRTILQRDFDYSDRINVVVPDYAAPAAPEDSANGHNYPLYARLGAAAALQVTMTPFGVHVAVHDVTRQRVERVKDFPLEGAPLTPAWRLSLHSVADEIVPWLAGGARGIAATRVIYSSGKRIWQIDSDGANPTPLTSVEFAAMAPAWHPKATHYVYSRMTETGTQIVLREMGGATRVLSGAPQYANATPVFSPDGATILFSHGLDRGMDLYAVNAFASDPMRRVTVGRGSDNISPTYSPDGRRIVYTSNRPGHIQLYISDADGTNSEPLTPLDFGDQRYRSNPDWSPDGRLVAFQSQIAGRFQVLTINPRDRQMRQYTNEGTNEDPSWAPDSRHLVFTSDRSGVKQLWVLDVESNRVRQLTRGPAAATAGAWSPMLRSR